MATLATFLQSFGRTAGPARPATGRGSNACLLRALPNEDLMLYTKKIDNSRLVRQSDPRSTGECLSTIGAVSALAIVLITTLTPSVAGMIAGYQIQSLKQEQQRLVNEGRGLEVEEARMLSTERLQILAEQHRMVSPKAGQVYHLNDASAGTVAANRPSADE
ncbi:MAG: hypothetical protein HYR60_12635 [Acidobacteria bacterium]|nr:hypothetical protein [Acidobacteriota bacterium]MBI3473733.1 hypothetical protein [Candidatus Solibacter usitatus]